MADDSNFDKNIDRANTAIQLATAFAPLFQSFLEFLVQLAERMHKKDQA